MSFKATNGGETGIINNSIYNDSLRQPEPEVPCAIPELLDASAQNWPDRQAVCDGERSLTYSELLEAVSEAADGLRSLGLNPGDRVAVFLPKRLENAVACLAILRAGGVLVPINPALKLRQVLHVLADAEPRFLITQVHRWRELAASGEAGIRGVEAVLTDADSVNGQPGTVPFQNLSAAVKHDQAARKWGEEAQFDLNQLAVLLYTSGSTGLPKGVMVSHGNLAYGVDSVVEYLALTSDDRILCSLPFSFDYGLNQFLSAVAIGACAVLIDYFHPQQVLQIIEREQITGLAGVPAMWVQFIRQQWAADTTRTLRYITNSGDRLTPSTLETLRSRLPHTRIYLMYGFTEAFRGTFLDPVLIEERANSIGKPVPHAQIEVVDGDFQVVPPGTVGELVQRGPLVTLGYWHDAARSAEKFASQKTDGVHPDWVRSGDLGWRDADGFLYFSGREDHLIKTAGYRVSRAEVEEVLAEVAGVAQAAVIAVPHDIWGQQIVAFVTTSLDGRCFDEDRLLQHCRRNMPRYMVPGGIELCAQLPLTANGKVDYDALRKAYPSAGLVE